MDGTVIDSGEAIYKTVNEVRDELNLSPLDKEFIIKAINEPGRNLPLEFYGIDTPSFEELISAKKSVEEVREYIGADSLEFLSIDELKESIGNERKYSLVSFDGDYFIK